MLWEQGQPFAFEHLPSLRQRLNARNQHIELGRIIPFRGFSLFDLTQDQPGEIGERPFHQKYSLV
jgi:hypothetical protein